MSAFYPSLTLEVQLRDKGLPVVKTIYTYGFHELFLKLTSKRQRYPDVTFIGRSKKYHSTAGYGPLHTHFRVRVLLIVEEPTMTEMQNLISISVILNSFSCSFTSIFFFFTNLLNVIYFLSKISYS